MINHDKINSKHIDDVGYRTLFTQDSYLMHVHKKSHGITRAIYLITDFFPEMEPIKVRMRQLGCDLMELVLSLSMEQLADRKVLLDKTIKTALALIAHSEIAMFTGIESEMNHNVLSTEIQNLIETIENREVPSRLGRHFVLDDSFFARDSSDVASHSHAPKHSSHNVNQSMIAPMHHTSNRASNAHIGLSVQHRIQKNEHDNESHKIKQSSVSGGKSTSELADQKKTERRNAIMSVIKSKGNPSIKEITDVVTDCSEKTIQRELLDMVANGQLKKEGERRWSRYTIV